MKFKNILVTGGYGFIGSNFINKIFQNNKIKFKNLINVDKINNASNINNISSNIKNNKKYIFKKLNLINKNKLKKIFDEYEIDLIIHFAAESHVDNSIINPLSFIENNINGFLNLIEISKKVWIKKKYKNKRFINISTDEVYGSLSKNEKSSNESSPYKPRSPYAASKAACDHIANSYYITFKFPIITTNCCNNFGSNQHNEKLIPKIIYNYYNNLPIPIYGDGKNIREWIHVYDHIEAIFKIIIKGRIGENYCIGTNESINNINLTKKIIKTLNKQSKINKLNLIKFVEDRKGHDFRYSIDSKKINKLGWAAKINLFTGLNNLIKLVKK